MKPHFKILAKMPGIDTFIAVQSLFPWEGEYTDDDVEATYSTRDSDNPEESDRILTSQRGAEIIKVTATTGVNGISIAATKNLVHDDALCGLLAAMGLNATIAGNVVQFQSTDAEQLSERLSNLDNVWCLMRRLAEFERDANMRIDAACKVIQFAVEWHKNRVQALQSDESDSARFQRATEDLKKRARDFKAWNITGLESINLLYDPRGSIIELCFKGHHPMGICALNFDWAVGKSVSQAMTQANRKTTFGKYEVRPTRIPEDVQGVLNGLVITGNEVKIVAKLPKKLYAKVDETLSTIGGQWHTGRQAHVFERDPTEMIDTLIETGEIYTAKDFEFFATQPALVSRVIAKADVQPGMKVLEPSAGRAALAMAAAEVVGKHNVTCFELMLDNVEVLQRMGFAVGEPTDFLTVQPEPIYDRVIANPPFSGGRDQAHILHAMKFLKPGGLLVAIASTQWQSHDTRPAKEFQRYLKDHEAEVEQVEAGAFKDSGTNVPTTMIAIRKPVLEEASPELAAANTVKTEDPLAFLL